MEFGPQDQDIVALLSKLKDVGGKYPEDLLSARRQNYLTKMAEIGFGVGAGTGIENAFKKAPPPAAAPVGSALLETALVVAIVAEASAVAYFYREKFSDFFQRNTTGPRVQEVTPPPAETMALEIQGVPPSAAVTATLPSATVSPIAPSPSGVVVTFTNTPIPGVVEESKPANPSVSEAKSTPAVNSNTNNDNTNNGNHYGQTPIPERTKDPGSNNDQNNSDQKPKDNSNNGDSNNNSDNQTPNEKPTKTK
jgi:hypothetical protein